MQLYLYEDKSNRHFNLENITIQIVELCLIDGISGHIFIQPYKP